VIYKYPVEKVDVQKLLRCFKPHFSYEGGYVGDEIHCKTIRDLRKHDEGILCHVDLSSGKLLLDEYTEFSDIEVYEEEYFTERLGKKKWQEILRIAKAQRWQPDLWLSCAISYNAVVLLVTLTDENITIQTGCVGGESERSSAYFEEGHLQSMPEIETMVKSLVENCLTAHKPEKSSRKPSRRK